MNITWAEKNYTEQEKNCLNNSEREPSDITSGTNFDLTQPQCKDIGGVKKRTNKKLTTDTFVQKCKKVHKSLYDYSCVKYVNSHKQVSIICKVHGKFNQLAYHHIRGHGCPKCKGEFIGNLKRLNSIDILKTAEKVHKNKYDYSKAVYKSKHNKIKIICPSHGTFLQKPGNHLRGEGCPKCSFNTSRAEIRYLKYNKVHHTQMQKFIFPYTVDGYKKNINTIYEFLGDYWHGNPNVYNLSDVNKKTKCSFGELHKNTFKKFKKLKKLGNNVKYIWESDWKRFEKSIDIVPKIVSY